jgi:hypothetical protein
MTQKLYDSELVSFKELLMENIKTKGGRDEKI